MSIDATDPIDASGDSLDVTQVCWTVEGENYDDGRESSASSQHTDFSNGDSAVISNTAETWGDGVPGHLEWQFTPQHDIASENFEYAMRLDTLSTEGTPGVNFILRDSSGSETVVNRLAKNSGLILNWYTVTDGAFGSGDGYTASNPDLNAGETYTVRVEVFDDDGVFDEHALNVDVVAPYDNRFESGLTFDNTVHQNDGYLDGPELCPDVVAAELGTVETRRDVTQADATITTNTTDANQYIELRIGGSSFDRTNNSTTASTTGGPARSIDVTLGLTRYPDDSNPQNATPRYGYNGQSIDDYELTANPDAVNASSLGTAEVDAVVPPGSIVGDQITEAAELDTNGDALTRAIFAQFSVLSGMEIRSSEKIEFNNDE